MRLRGIYPVDQRNISKETRLKGDSVIKWLKNTELDKVYLLSIDSGSVTNLFNSILQIFSEFLFLKIMKHF